MLLMLFFELKSKLTLIIITSQLEIGSKFNEIL